MVFVRETLKIRIKPFSEYSQRFNSIQAKNTIELLRVAFPVLCHNVDGIHRNSLNSLNLEVVQISCIFFVLGIVKLWVSRKF